MEKPWQLALIVFIVVLYLFYRATYPNTRIEYGPRAWHVWGAKVYYWQAAVIISGGITFFTMVLLEWANVVVL